MKAIPTLQTIALTASVIASSFIGHLQKAIAFEEQPINPQQYILVAVPFGYQEYRLEIIEQLPGGQPCWQENPSNPTTVNLLLDNFDYTHSCRRITNTNGYTLRINGQDDIVTYVNKIVPSNGSLQLVAFHKNPSQPNLAIGSTNGISKNPLKIFLNPGWQVTKRVDQGKLLNHVYLSANSATAQNNVVPNTTGINNSNSSPSNFNNGAIQSTSQPTISSNTNLGNAPGFDANTLVNGLNQVYTSVVNPILNTVVGGVNTTNNSGNQCPGKALLEKPGISPQSANIYGDGTLVFANNQQFNIRPILSQNNINPDQFLFQPGSTQLDLDGDGIIENLTIQQPVSFCSNSY